jgi:tetraacyldisaccharide-1-P 4'-kinase
MPPLAPHYVERKEATSFMENALFDQGGAIKPGAKIVVVTGIGGCGKTQLIRKFVENHKERYVSVEVFSARH